MFNKQINSRKFFHQRLQYEFKWAKSKSVINEMPEMLGKKIFNYIERIRTKNFPYELFDDPNSMRCSKFKVKKLKRGALKKIGLELIAEGKITPYYLEFNKEENKEEIPNDLFRSLVFHARQTSKVYKEQFNQKPGHDPVLNRILLLEPFAIAVEIPVWLTPQSTLEDYTKDKPTQRNLKIKQKIPKKSTLDHYNFINKKDDHKAIEKEEENNEIFSFTGPKPLTGHIDIMLYHPNEKALIIADYKPEGQFIRSIPQIIVYGLIIRRIFNKQKIICVSFNENEAWAYDPLTVGDALEKKVEIYGDPQLEWRKIIPKISDF